jgi:hypothetical protein
MQRYASVGVSEGCCVVCGRRFGGACSSVVRDTTKVRQRLTTAATAMRAQAAHWVPCIRSHDAHVVRMRADVITTM